MKEFLTSEEIGGRLGVSRQQVARLVKRGRLPAVKSGRCIRVPVAAWEQFMANQTAAALAAVKQESAKEAAHAAA